jgi:hypothetical protein
MDGTDINAVDRSHSFDKVSPSIYHSAFQISCPDSLAAQISIQTDSARLVECITPSWRAWHLY